MDHLLRLLSHQRRPVTLHCHRVIMVEVLEHGPYILDSTLSQLLQEASQNLELLVVRFKVPAPDFYAIVLLPVEVVPDIVHDDAPTQISAQSPQVLVVNSILRRSMLSVKSIVNRLLLWVQRIDDLICIVLCGCRENHDFKVRTQSLEEGEAVRA
jgi:hypothetical protein